MIPRGEAERRSASVSASAGAAASAGGWLEDELRAPGALRELARVLRRAAARPHLVLAIAVLVAAAVVASRGAPPRFGARVVLRVVEGDLDDNTAPRPTRHLREHVESVAFSDGRLRALIEAEGLYSRQRALGDRLALEAMRDDLTVEVWRNYFVQPIDPDPDAPPRSARIAVRWQAPDPILAQRVTLALARIIVEEREESRRLAAAAAARVAEEALAEAKAELGRRRAAAVRIALALDGASERGARRDPLRAVELAVLERSMAAMEEDLERRTHEAAALARRRALEGQGLGLRFEIVDEEAPVAVPSRARALVTLGVVVLAMVLPLGAIAVGAFDPRVRDLDDVRRLGLVALGRVRLPRDRDRERARAGARGRGRARVRRAARRSSS